MFLTGKFVFISSDNRTSNGRQYFNVNIESEGTIYRMGVDPAVLGTMQKYQEYIGTFKCRVWDNRMYLDLVDAQPVPVK